MVRPPSRLSGWHNLAVGLLFSFALLGAMWLVPLLFLIPALRCGAAGKALNRNVPGAGGELRKGHSIGMAFLSVGATLVGAIALGTAMAGMWDAFVIFLLLSSAGLFAMFASWMALEGAAAPELPPEINRPEPGPTSSAFQTSLPPAATEPDEDIELPYAEVLRLATRVDWHSYVCSALLVLVCILLPLSALSVVTFCSAGLPPPPLSPLVLMMPPLAMLFAFAFCHLAGTRLSWARAAHTATFCIAASLAVLAGTAVLATFVTTRGFWWHTSLEIVRALAAAGVVWMTTIAFGSSRVLRALATGVR